MSLDTSRLNKHDKVYHQLTYGILTSKDLNFRKADRVVIDTIGVFGNQVVYDISDGTIPLSNTKNLAYKTQLFPEIVGFLRNENNLKWYLEQGMNIWTANAFNFYRKKLDDKHPWKNLTKDTPEFNQALDEYKEIVMSGSDASAGDLGNFYPKQWRSFKGYDELTGKLVRIDQLSDYIDRLIEHPSGRYHLVTAWNPFDVKYKTAALSPCHCMFQGYVRKDDEGVTRLDLKMHQRSADHLLGVAFNAPQYSTLTAIFAKLVSERSGKEVRPGRFYHSFGDIHVYVGNGKRSAWYKDKNNRLWLQEQLKENEPNDVLENLLDRLPDEGDFPGYDHVPYLIQQLGRVSTSMQPAKLKVYAKTLEDIEVKDLEVTGYKRPPKLEINGIFPGMAS